MNTQKAGALPGPAFSHAFPTASYRGIFYSFFVIGAKATMI